MIYRASVEGAQKSLWFFFIYAITALPIIGLLYAQAYIRIMVLDLPIGTKFAQVFALFYIGIALILLGAFVLYYKFLVHMKDIFNILHLETFDLHKYFLVASILFLGVNLIGGYILWIGSYTIGYYISIIANPKSIISSLTAISKLYLRHLFFEIFYTLEASLTFILTLITSISLRIISSRTGILVAEIAAWIAWITAGLFIIYIFISSNIYILIGSVITLVILMILLGTLSLKLPGILMNMYAEREKLVSLEIPPVEFEE